MPKRRSVKQAALAYAAEGWPVLACYTNTSEGCACGDSGCFSPGKHPNPKFSPNGVQSATTDLDEIAKWPKSINIGIAQGHKDLMALDVDDAEIAAALLAPETVLHDETGAVRTGRGVHVYFLCSGKKKTQHLRDKVTGNKIGHIAGVGAYTIAPPSAAPGGKFYRWLGQGNDQWIPRLTTTNDALKYIKRLLKPHGVEVVTTASVDIENLPDTEIEEHDLKDISPRLVRDSDLLRIKQRLRGKREEGARDTDKDLSGWEHFVACQILRTGKRYKIKRVEPEILAGIIKKLDRVYYGKFQQDVETGKRSQAAADRRYLVAAIRAMDAENVKPPRAERHSEPREPVEMDDTEPDVIGIVDEPTYYWDEDVGKLYFMQYHKKSSTATRVANFNLRLVSEIMIDKGQAVPDRAWSVEFISPLGTTKRLSLKAEEFDSTHSLEKALSRKLSHEFVVAHNGHVHLKPAILELTKHEDVQRFAIRAVPGWWTITNDDGNEERVFLLPSALGAISRHGMLPELRMRVEELAELDDEITQKEFVPYGLGVRPPTTDERPAAWKALRALATCAPSEVTMPIILQVLMGPLWAAGADEVPSLLHVTGQTGVLKSSFCQAAMSLLGTFRKTTPPTANWGSVSPSALRVILNAAKDLTVLVDDYKKSVTYDSRGMVELIQAYADKAVRQRLRSSGERRKSLELQAVMLSNGEDRWERQASMVARTIFLEIKDYDIKDDLLHKAQQVVDDGDLQLMGGHYLSWLAGQDTLFEEREVEELREIWHRRLLKATKKRDMHRRLLASVATMAAVGDIFLRFVEECYPTQHAEAKRWVRTAIRGLVFGTRARAKEVKKLAPLRQLLGHIASEAEARKVSFEPVDGVSGTASRLPDSPGTEIVGWWSTNKKRRMMHLNESTTFGWYRREMKKQGNDITFSWNAVVQEAKNDHGASEHRMRVGRHKRQIRLISMPLDLLNLLDLDEGGAN